MNRREVLKNGAVLTAGTLLFQNGLQGMNTDAFITDYRFIVDWNNPGELFKHTWEGIGNVDQFRWMVRGDMQEQLAMVHKELNMRHVRAVGIFDEEMKVYALDPTTWRDKERKPTFNWQVIDYVIQSLLDRGIHPMITTTFMPYLMASGEQYCFSTKANVTPPKDYGLWKELVTASTRHFVDHFGLDTVKQWYFEVWNEPNLDAFWKGADKQEFFRIWKETYHAIKSVNKDFRIGGPSAARAEWIGDFLAWTRKEGCEPDYIITHVYNNDSENAALSPFAGPQTDKINNSPHFLSGVVKGVRKLLDDVGFKGEVHFNEWGRSWFPSDDVRETPNEAAFIVKTMAECSQEADYFAYWCLSDIYDQLGYTHQAFAGTYGMLNIHGLKKPSYKAHEMLCRLGDLRLPVQSTGADLMCNGLATKSSDAYQFLFYAMEKDYKQGDAIAQKNIVINLPKGAKEKNVKVYQLSAQENNVLHGWRQIGSPAYLKPKQVEQLRQYNQLAQTKVPYQISKTRDGFVLNTTIEIPGLLLIEVQP